mmetsp:Transcript_60431/g.112226  ORF Transcript_60431/g.112226 Transcript_60431/m.112226 type:complete len:781 (+) Transcript_60431:131-2473(+)
MAHADRNWAEQVVHKPASARGAKHGEARETVVVPHSARYLTGSSAFPRVNAGSPAGASPPPQHGAPDESSVRWKSVPQPASVRLPALVAGAKEHSELVLYDEGAATDLQQQIDFYAIELRKEAALSEQRHGQLLSFATQIEDLKQTISELQEQLAAKASAERELQEQLADQEVQCRMKELEVESCRQQLEEAKQTNVQIQAQQVSKEKRKLQPSQVEFQVLGAKTEARFYADAVSDMIRQQRLEVSRIVAMQREKLLTNFECRVASWGSQGHLMDIVVAWHNVAVVERHIKRITRKAVQERRFADAHTAALAFWDESASIERLLLVLSSWSRVVPGGRGRHAIQRQHAKEDRDEQRHRVGMICWVKEWERFRLRATWSRWCTVIIHQRKEKKHKKEALEAHRRFDRSMLLWKTDNNCMRMFVVLRAWDAWMCLQARRGSFTGHFGVQELAAGDGPDDGYEGFARTFQISYNENWRSVLDSKVQAILAEDLGVVAVEGGTSVGSGGPAEASAMPPNLSVSILDCHGNPVSSTEDTRLPEESFPLTVEVSLPADGHSIEIYPLEEPSASAGPKMTSSLSMLSQASQSVGGLRRGVASSTVHSAARHRQQQNNFLISVAMKCWEQERMQFEAHMLLTIWQAGTLYRKKQLRSRSANRKTIVDRAVLRWGANIDSLALQAVVSAWASMLSSRMGQAAKARYDELITKAAALWSSDQSATHLQVVVHAWRDCVAQKWKEAASVAGSEQTKAERRAEEAQRRAAAAEARAAKADEAKKGSCCCVVQ